MQVVTSPKGHTTSVPSHIVNEHIGVPAMPGGHTSVQAERPVHVAPQPPPGQKSPQVESSLQAIEQGGSAQANWQSLEPEHTPIAVRSEPVQAESPEHSMPHGACAQPKVHLLPFAHVQSFIEHVPVHEGLDSLHWT